MSSVFDFETGPLPHHILAEKCEPFVPPPHPGEFDPSSVAYGNTKDPEKRAAKLKTCEDAHAESVRNYEVNCETARLAHFNEVVDRAALDPTLGQLLAIGVYDLNTGKYIMGTVSESRTEEQLIAKFWSIYEDHRKNNRRLIGHNILNFDLPFIVRRSWILGIDIPTTVREGRYFDRLFVDIRDAWLCGQHFGQCTSSLDHISKQLEIGEKNGEGAKFHELLATDRDAALAYLQNDLLLTTTCAKRMGIAA